jgi:hypothetical protein
MGRNGSGFLGLVRRDSFFYYRLGYQSWPVCSLVVVKVILGVHLVGYAIWRRAGMETREREDEVNDYGRDSIGEGKEEQVLFSFMLLQNFSSYGANVLGL